MGNAKDTIGSIKKDGYEIRFSHFQGKIGCAIFKDGVHTRHERIHFDKWEVLDTYTPFFGSKELSKLDFKKKEWD